jgi:RNA polymerase primary sigma factor
MINHQNIGLEQEEEVILDPESDDSEASDILELIERESTASQEPEVPSEPVPAAAKAPAEDFALESLYFRSFGERPLLKRDEEIALAKRIDQGTRAIRAVLRDTLKLAVKMRKEDVIVEAVQQLNEVRQLSGFSATALDNTERIVATLVKAARQHRAGGYREKQFERSIRQIREARLVLERAKDEMVRCNLRLVVDIAKHYNGKGLGLLDLIQEGNIGLMKAAERYQYRKGFKFSTYATWWVRQGITRSLADQSRTIRIPVHMTESSHRIVRTTRRLAQQFGREPKPEEIGRSLQIHPDKIKDTLQIFQEPVSLDNPVGDGETLFGELIADRHAMPPDSHVNRTELTRELDRILSTLTPREQVVIRMRFGIGQDEPFTLEQVGQNLSVTRERIRQIEAKALKKLKTPEIKQMFAAIKD